VRFAQSLIQFTGGQVEVASGEQPAVHSIRLEFDINTSQAHAEPFKSDEYMPIFNELISLASENAEKGEQR
jgi:hypothetical protein